jgi:hypothetical protein
MSTTHGVDKDFCETRTAVAVYKATSTTRDVELLEARSADLGIMVSENVNTGGDDEEGGEWCCSGCWV